MAKIIDNYILLEQICQGTFGEIHKGRNLVSKEQVAVKTVQLEQFMNDSTLRDMIINEIQALKKLEDPNIIKMIKMLKSSNNIYLIYEFLSGRNLKKLLNERHHLTEMEAIQIFQQICKGFQKLSSQKIIKKNLNSHNVHILEQSNENNSNQQSKHEVKLKHFFICKSSSSNSTSSKKFEQHLFDKFHYVAPELLSTQINQQTGNSANRTSSGISFQQESACDVFSAGIVLYEMLLGSLPFEKYANTKEDLIEFYSNNNIGDVISQDINNFSLSLQNLLKRMIVVDWKDRITWDELFEMIGSFDAKLSNNDSSQQQNHSSNQHSLMNNPHRSMSSGNNVGVRDTGDDDEYNDDNNVKRTNMNGQYGQGQTTPNQQGKQKINHDYDDEDNQYDDGRQAMAGKSTNDQSLNQKSNKKSKSNTDNAQMNQLNSGVNNLANNSSQQKQKYRNHSEMAQQMNNQETPQSISSPNAVVNLNYNKQQQQQYATTQDNQKELNGTSTNPFYGSINSKLNKENTSNRVNDFSGNIKQAIKRENSSDLSNRQLNNGNINNNIDNTKNKEVINLILDEVMDKRSALDNCMDQDEWNIQSLNVYSCGYILLKKACGLSEYLMTLFEQPEKVLSHLNLSYHQLQAWQQNQKRQLIKLHIMKENLELNNNIMKYQDDFSENIELKINNKNSYNKNRKGDEIENDDILNNLLFETSKEMSQISYETKNRKSLVLAHYLADIACIDIMYNKFLGKKRLDVLNHPYFKKLSEISREKLQENLDNKFKLYDYHRNYSEA